MRQFLRRVFPQQVVFDENQKKWRVSSATFKDPNMSCDDHGTLVSSGKSWEATLEGYDGFSLVQLSEDLVVSNDQKIVDDPIIPDNPAHVLIVGKKRQPVVKNFVKGCVDLKIIPYKEQ